MAIAPLPVPAMPGAMDAFTAQIAGVSAQTAYDTYMKDEYRLGNDEYIGYTTITTDKPAISGDSSNTIVSSQSTDPIEAWSDAEEDYSVPKQTGGLSSGSKVSSIALSLMEKTGLSAEAVVPVAVPIDAAIVAASQAVGVSMDIATLDIETKNAFIEAVSANGSIIYDKARDLVTAWKDSLGNILFPKSLVDSVNDVIEEKGIGDSTGKVLPSGTVLNPMPRPYPVPVNFVSHFSATDSQPSFDVEALSGVVTMIKIYAGEVGNWRRPATIQIWGATPTPNTPFARVRANGGGWWTLSTGSSNYLSIDGKDSYMAAGNISPGATAASVLPVQDLNNLPQCGWALLYGVSVGGYPEGTSASAAPSYSPSELVQRGSVMGSDHARTPVVVVNLPENPYNSTGSTIDPNSATDDANAGVIYPGLSGENGKESPIPLPIPDTNISNPDVPLTDSSVVNSTLVNELVEELANTLDPQPSQSSGIIPIPYMPGIVTPGPDPEVDPPTIQYPSIVPASGSGLIHVYNPTPGEFVSFGNWLWVTYADSTIEKIWNNPFDGIIGAFELYCTPQIDGYDNIRSGFLTCPTTAGLVRQRYIEIDCGTVIVPEYYGNYLDYSPYSQAYIYLPFIGINEVSIDDVVGHAVKILYRVDCYNGSCIAMIFVAKDGYQNLCYQFAGSCSVEVPLAGGSQAAIKAGVLQAEAYARATMQTAQIQKTADIGTGVLRGAQSGGGNILGGIIGALAGGAAGYVSGEAGVASAQQQAGAQTEAARYANKSSVQHSGQFGASHGAMGMKTPFILIRNPVQVKVTNYNEEYGYPAHKRVIVGGCHGFLRVQECHVISAHATDEEKVAIEQALKSGVFVD